MKQREFMAGTAALLVSPRRLWAQGTSRRIGFLANFELLNRKVMDVAAAVRTSLRGIMCGKTREL